MKTAGEIKIQKAKYYVANREKILTRHAVYRAANSEKIKAHNAAWYARNAEKLRTYHAKRYASGKILKARRMKMYGVSPEDFQLILSAQKNACGICREIFSGEPNVDHCHKTGKVRGLLCSHCNRGLGHFQDSLEVLYRATEYLQGRTTLEFYE